MRFLTIFCGVLLAAVLLAVPASAAPQWAPADSATIHPGVNTETKGASCTSNFIFHKKNRVYIGQAAHCSGTGEATETDGCDAQSLPEGTEVTVDGAEQPGKLVYNSWIRMQARGETDENACAFNDFALVRLSKADAAKVNPSIPFFGGPTGISDGVTGAGRVFSYGNSALRQGIEALSPKYGLQVGETDGGGWNHTVLTLTPGIPGDSGSAFVDQDGGAFGVLSTLAFAPLPASNGVGDLAKELEYAAQFPKFRKLKLAEGTEPFEAPALPLNLF